MITVAIVQTHYPGDNHASDQSDQKSGESSEETW